MVPPSTSATRPLERQLLQDIQGPMASYIGYALVGPVDFLRSSMANYGIKPKFTLPLHYRILEDKQSYWRIVTD